MDRKDDHKTKRPQPTEEEWNTRIVEFLQVPEVAELVEKHRVSGAQPDDKLDRVFVSQMQQISGGLSEAKSRDVFAKATQLREKSDAKKLMERKEFKQLAQHAIDLRQTFLAVETSSAGMKQALKSIQELRNLLEADSGANNEVIHAIPDVDSKIYYCATALWCRKCDKECIYYCKCMKQ